MPTAERPLRKDAERSRQRIRLAARDLLARDGLSVTLNEIARHANLGVATVYRRYPDRLKLIDELFEDRLENLATLMEAAIQDPDPWHGLADFLEHALDLQAADRGFKELLTGAVDGLDAAARLRRRMLPLAARLVERARTSGQLRQDVQPQDLPVLQLMLGAVIDGSRDISPDLWRRYLEIMLQGLRASPNPPEHLPLPPLTPRRTQDLMTAATTKGR